MPKPVNPGPPAGHHTGTTANDDTITLTTASTSVMSFLIDPATLLANDTVHPGFTGKITAAQGITGGTVQILPSGQLQVVPSNPFAPSDSFRYTLDDGHGGTSSAVATVHYTVANSPPVAVDDNLTIPIGLGTPQEAGTFTGDYLANDHDPNGDPLTIVGIGAVTPLADVQVPPDPNGFDPFDPRWKVELLLGSNDPNRNQINITVPPGSTSAKIGFDYIVADNHGGFDTGYRHRQLDLDTQDGAAEIICRPFLLSMRRAVTIVGWIAFRFER